MKVFVDVHDKRWNKYKIDFEKIVNAVVSGVYKDSEVSIVLVDDDEIQSINNTYRGIDKPTKMMFCWGIFIFHWILFCIRPRKRGKHLKIIRRIWSCTVCFIC